MLYFRSLIDRKIFFKARIFKPLKFRQGNHPVSREKKKRERLRESNEIKRHDIESSMGRAEKG